MWQTAWTNSVNKHSSDTSKKVPRTLNAKTAPSLHTTFRTTPPTAMFSTEVLISSARCQRDLCAQCLFNIPYNGIHEQCNSHSDAISVIINRYVETKRHFRTSQAYCRSCQNSEPSYHIPRIHYILHMKYSWPPIDSASICPVRNLHPMRPIHNGVIVCCLEKNNHCEQRRHSHESIQIKPVQTS